MKSGVLLFIVCVIAIFSALNIVNAVPTKSLGPHVHYVDDKTVGYYIDNPRFVTYLYIYSHSYICVKCAAAGELISKLAKEFNGQIYVLGMDASDQYNRNTIERLQIDPNTTQFPIVFEFPSDKSTNGIDVPITTIDYVSLKKRTNDLIQLQGQVKQLDGTNMKKYLSFKTSSKPKAVLLTTKAQVPTLWASLSSQFSHKFDFYMGLKTDRKVVKRFDVDNFPTILILRQTEYNMDQPEDTIEPIIYTGQMKASSIKAFLSLYTPIDATKIQDTQPYELYRSVIDSTHDFIPVLSDDQCFTAHCSVDNINSSGLCVLFITPTIFSPESMDFAKLQEIQYQIEVIRNVEELRLENHLNWGLVIGQQLSKDEIFSPDQTFTGVYPTFYESFNIQPQDYPQLIIYNPRKNGYTTFLGAFNTDNINSWIGDVIGGSSGLNPLNNNVSEKTIAQTFPTITPSRCKYLYDKRAQALADIKAMEERKKQSSKTGQSQQQPSSTTNNKNIPEGTNELDIWSKPYRPFGKKGELREMTDKLWKDVYVKRSMAILLQFLDRPNEKIDKDIEHDINTFKTTIESLNGMVEGYYVQCNDDTIHIRELFGIDNCDGLIIGIKPRASVTANYLDLELVGKELAATSTIFETIPEEVKSSTITFTKDSLYKFAQIQLFSGISPYRLPQSSDALQQWLLKSIKEPKVMIFTKKDDILLVKALIVEFYGFAQVGIVGPEHDSLIHQFQVDTFPAVRIIIPSIQPRVGGTHGEMEMKLDLIPIPKQQLYYNAIATHLDNVVSLRYVGDKAENGAPFEPLRKEHPVETMVREHYEERDRKARRDEL